MNKNAAPIGLQEEEYSFPYHYITKFGEVFSQHLVDSWGINYAITLDFILRRVREKNPAEVVDIGCGDGRLTRELSFTGSIKRLLGIDFSRKAIGLARAMNADRAEIEFRALDITQTMEIPPFDLCVLMEVFEHIPLDECEKFMGGVRASLKTGGSLLITVPHANKPLEYKHYQHFTVASLVRYLEQGFWVERVVPFERQAFSRRILDRLLCNRWFVLNNQRALNLIYAYHKKHLFSCNGEKDCQRLYVEAVAI